MTKTHLQFEVVPVEVVERLLKQQNNPAKRGRKRKAEVRKTGRTENKPHVVPKKVEVLLP
jgi:hypothetical protein